jgi:hypothetical protein
MGAAAIQFSDIFAGQRPSESGVLRRPGPKPDEIPLEVNLEPFEVGVTTRLNAPQERRRVQRGHVNATKIGARNSVQYHAKTEAPSKGVGIQGVMARPKAQCHRSVDRRMPFRLLRSNFVCALIMVNKEERLGRGRQEASSEEFRGVLDDLDDLLQTLVRRVRKAKADYDKNNA